MVLDKINPKETNPALLGPIRQPVRKLRFRLDDIPYFDTSFMCEPVGGPNYYDGESGEEEAWDAPLQRKKTVGFQLAKATQMPYDQFVQTDISGIDMDYENINEPFSRDPLIPLKQFKP